MQSIYYETECNTGGMLADKIDYVDICACTLSLTSEIPYYKECLLQFFALINEDDTLASGSDILDSFNLSSIKSERIKAEVQNNDWNTLFKTFKSGCSSEEKF
uniref:Uncharacterized protein n=1 Tax=Romanomermis culicivorax TaxID=13658 RepID=A0A915KU24_ROMCU